jgi:hypothetical protein
MAMMKDAELLRYTQKVEMDVLAEYIKDDLGGKVPEKYNTLEGRIKLVSPAEGRE